MKISSNATGTCSRLRTCIPTQPIHGASTRPSAFRRTWKWLLNGLVSAARALIDTPCREHLRLLCAQMWTGSTCRPYIVRNLSLCVGAVMGWFSQAMSPCYRWFALVMSLLIDGDTEEKIRLWADSTFTVSATGVFNPDYEHNLYSWGIDF